MKSTIKTKLLTEALSRMKLVCGTRTTLPVLTCVRLLVANGEMKVEATNLDTFLSITVEADSAVPGECIVACNRLLDGLKQAGESAELTAEKEHLAIQFDESVMRLRTLNPEEFPKWPETEGGAETQVDSGILSALIARAMPFVSRDDSVMSGVFVQKNGTGVNVVGCDRRQLIAIHSEEIKQWGTDVIISKEVAKLLAAFEGEISVQVAENHICVRGDGWNFASRLIANPYPNWKCVIPDSKSTKIKITVNRVALLRATRLAIITAVKESGTIILEADKGGIVVKSQDADSDLSSSRLPAKVFGKVIIGINPRHLLGMIEAVSDEDFALQIEDDKSPILIESENVQMTMSPSRVQ